MLLVESIPLQDHYPSRPPARFDLGRIVVPSETDLTLIAVRHDVEYGEPDYLHDMLLEADLFLPEGAGYDKKGVRDYKALAKGNYKARERLLYGYSSGGDASGVVTWKKSVIKQLYGTKVGVELTDIPAGLIYNGYKSDFAAMLKNNVVNGPALLRRDQHILEQLCGAMDGAQRIRSSSDQPLKVVGQFGLLHVPGIVDALNEAARQQNVTTFNGSILFEESCVDIEDHDSESFKSHVEYQTWLRSSDATLG